MTTYKTTLTREYVTVIPYTNHEFNKTKPNKYNDNNNNMNELVHEISKSITEISKTLTFTSK
jgi:hypothetical protein